MAIEDNGDDAIKVLTSVLMDWYHTERECPHHGCQAVREALLSIKETKSERDALIVAVSHVKEGDSRG